MSGTMRMVHPNFHEALARGRGTWGQRTFRYAFTILDHWVTDRPVGEWVRELQQHHNAHHDVPSSVPPPSVDETLPCQRRLGVPVVTARQCTCAGRGTDDDE